ncbi:TRAP transporter substrate-binding protein [Aliirhizobium cellulosilyticum]|uniref:TRAP-type C4-dicarboxylate transport system substrate-binding protein n=1 Tax=Aliirhizobium cellulosilyticum TaxID=393664 RepID=A0A7W6S9L5_9HYPH|nr:TRAP transporter substrate-binding protein [Rhizobium cellulosilyticum]MBB4349694.1 TRAP-type C4-dicarboxylate transport system substrate-binding protein [Rhizobium cellulosilyticum]MBB4412085.1 TRAP-type C4-dicarboxylate transport system substrate-binding protein [Rhizobium cellulosilyticum]MBB4446716.1 TRAP-type C4-dicarboxylate transport system substrate-binding protein [Rhizobium cellulosilyticum]
MNVTGKFARWGLAAAALLATTAPSFAANWVLPSAYPPANYHVENLNQFAKDIDEATKGELKITVHPNASLFKAPDIKRAVQTGQAQVGEVLLSLHENENPVFGLDVVPFLATSFDQSKKLYDASKPAIEQALDKQGLKLLYATPWPPQGIFTKKDVNSVADLKGLKWRAYNVGTSRIAEIVGAQPVTVQAAELPQALATGVVDGLMTSSATGVDSKIWESLTHYYDTQAWIPKNAIFVNKAAFAALDPATQKAVTDAAAAAESRGWALAAERTKSYMDTLKKNGMQVLEPSAELKTGLSEVGAKLTEDWSKKAGADGQAILDAYKR